MRLHYLSCRFSHPFKLLPSSTFYNLLFAFSFFHPSSLPSPSLNLSFSPSSSFLHPFFPSFFTPALSPSPSHLIVFAQLHNLNFFLLHMQRETNCRSVLKTSLDNDNSKGVTVFCEVLALYTATVNPLDQCNGHVRG